MIDDRMQFALIGCGAISHDQAEALIRMPEVELTTVYDLDESRSSSFARRYGARSATSLAELLDQPDNDAVIISTPTHTHYQIALEAAAAGKHMLVEKPVALSLSELTAMQGASDRAGVNMMAGHLLRFDRTIGALHDSITSGELGDPVLFNWVTNTARPWPEGWRAWQTDPAESGGMALHLGIHGIDLAIWLMNDSPHRVYAQGANVSSPGLEIHDYFHINVRFDNDTNALLESNSALRGSGNQYREFRMYGTRGQAQWNHRDDGMVLDDRGIRFTSSTAQDNMYRQIQHFAACCREHTRPIVTPEETRLGLATAIAARRSLQTGQAVLVSDVTNEG